MKADQNVLGGPKEEFKDYLDNVSYFDYLKNTLGVDDPAVLQIARHTSIDYTEVGTDALGLGDVLSSAPLGGRDSSTRDRRRHGESESTSGH